MAITKQHTSVRSTRGILQRKFYDNIRMLSPEGDIMCRMSRKRADWYLARQLAVLEDNGLAIRLTISPRGPGWPSSEFYTLPHVDQCVVCGSTEELTRHHCVPRCYRVFFESRFKTALCHDVLLVCARCHDAYEELAYELKMTEICIPESERRRRSEIARGIRASNVLLKHWDRIPGEKFAVIMFQIARALGKPVDSVVDSDLRNLASQALPRDIAAGDWEDVVQREGPQTLIRRWRTHFVETMHPKFLPAGWSIEGPEERL